MVIILVCIKEPKMREHNSFIRIYLEMDYVGGTFSAGTNIIGGNH